MITSRDIYGHGLMTGMGIREMRTLTPGFILDMVIIRSRTLEKMFGGKKKKQMEI